MEQNIINSLILYKQEFDKKYEEFAFKQDIESVHQHELANYLQPLIDNIVPLLSKYLKEEPDAKISHFNPYIVPKYHEIIKNEVINYEKNSINMIKNIGKNIIDSFLRDLMTNSKESDKYKLDFLNKFFKSSSHLFNVLIKNDVLYTLTVCSKLRNPKIQTMIIGKFSNEFNVFINSCSQEFFDKEILPLFNYPLNISIEEYYKKWIAKEFLHVKFSKNILGIYYEYTKKILKYNSNLKKEK